MKTEKEIKERIEGLKIQIRFSVENTNCSEAIRALKWVLE